MHTPRPLVLAVVLTLTVLACEAPSAPSPPDVGADARAGAPRTDSVPPHSPTLPPDTVDVQGVQAARARVQPVGSGGVSGTVTLSRVAGGVRVLAEVEGLTAEAYHAVQILRGRDCAADPAVHLGVAAGTPHGGPYSPPGLRHAGDLGNVRAQDGGYGRYDRIDAALSLDGTASPVGRAVVVRAGRDDAASPDGAAGEVIGCGVLEGVR